MTSFTGTVAYVTLTPGQHDRLFAVVVLDDAGSPWQCSRDGTYTVNGMPVTFLRLWAMFADATTPLKAVLYPDQQLYGVITRGEFTTAV